MRPDPFELRDRLVAAMPENWPGCELFTIYDEDHRLDSVRVLPDLSRAETGAQVAYLCDPEKVGGVFRPVVQIWTAAPTSLRIELARLLGADSRLSDEDGVTITRTVIDLAVDPASPSVE